MFGVLASRSRKSDNCSVSLDDLRRQQEKEFERQKVLAPAVASRMALARQFFIECLPAITEEVQRRSGLQRLSSGWQEDDHAEMSGYLSVPGVERGIEFRTTGGLQPSRRTEAAREPS